MIDLLRRPLSGHPEHCKSMRKIRFAIDFDENAALVFWTSGATDWRANGTITPWSTSSKQPCLWMIIEQLFKTFLREHLPT